MKNILVVLSLCLLLNTIGYSQYVKQAHSGEIYKKLEKFNFLGSALYVAAHPDDENTRLISYLSNGLNARTAYLSITRGDGGQNLIGTEISELLGVIRSQELQMARKTDGGSQLFTRANDFGFSKHPDETLIIWDKEQVVEDMVQAIRQFKPDIIVNRFDHRSPGKTHGHHTSSAMLALEAYELAQDSNYKPQQVRQFGTWKSHRQFFNTSWWFYGSREKFEEADKSRLVPVDVGIYFPSLGMSNNEISAIARSQHRSQGFGSSGDRGNYQEYLELLNGDMPEDKTNLFDGINTTWSRVEGGKVIQDIMDKIMSNYDFKNPSSIVNDLLLVHQNLNKLKDNYWKQVKLQELNELIVSCLGLYLEASTDQQQFSKKDSVEIELEWTNRSEVEMISAGVSINGVMLDYDNALESFTTIKEFHKSAIDQSSRFTNPYWLDQDATLGMYRVDNEDFRNLPESPPAINCVFYINIGGNIISVDRPVNYRYVNPAIGEIREPIFILPPAALNFDKELYLQASNNNQNIQINVKALTHDVKGTLNVVTPEGWNIEPKTIEFELPLKGQEGNFTFALSSPNKISEEYIYAQLIIDGEVYDKKYIEINYDHIPKQCVLSTAKSKLVKVPMSIAGNKLAYIMGAGDKVPESLVNVGYEVQMLEVKDINNTNLDAFDAVVIGVRAYNTLPELKLHKDKLFGYVENGGTLITQYNTSRGLDYNDIAPYRINLSRDRVTDESAEIRLLKPQHKVFNFPNKISDTDFDNWVQERGLYYADEWDEKYEAVLSCNDKDENALDGSLLIAPHGNGYFVYTSLSWFRQLPAGVPGAFRLFSNMLALSQSDNDRP